MFGYIIYISDDLPYLYGNYTSLCVFIKSFKGVAKILKGLTKKLFRLEEEV